MGEQQGTADPTTLDGETVEHPTPTEAPPDTAPETPTEAPADSQTHTEDDKNPQAPDDGAADVLAKLAGPADPGKEADEVDDDTLVKDPFSGLPKEYVDTLHTRTRGRIQKLNRLAKEREAELAQLREKLDPLEQDAAVFRLLEQTVPVALKAKAEGQALPPDIGTLKPIYDALHQLFGETPATPALPQTQPAPEAGPDLAALDEQLREAMIDFDLEKAQELMRQKVAAEAKAKAPPPTPQPPAQPQQAPQQAPQPAPQRADPVDTYYATQAFNEIRSDLGGKATAQQVIQHFDQVLMPRIAEKLAPLAQQNGMTPVQLFERLPPVERHRLTGEARATEARAARARASQRQPDPQPLSSQEAFQRVSSANGADVEQSLVRILSGG